MKEKIKYLLLKILRVLTNDTLYYHIRFIFKFRKILRLNKPVTFNEKLHWLKLNDRKPIYSTLVDKYAVREFVKERIGEKYLIPLVGIYDNTNEIDFEKLPTSFVLKATHGSGWVIVCTNKKQLNWSDSLKEMNFWLSNNFYSLWGEWPYKNVKPRIICEKFLSGDDKEIPKDYKFYCFDGDPKFVHVDIDRFDKHTRNFYDLNWVQLPFSLCYPNNSVEIVKKPQKLEEMVQIAKKLSSEFKFVRVDLYEIKNQIYFGELTFFPGNGLERFNPVSFDKEIGKLL